MNILDLDQAEEIALAISAGEFRSYEDVSAALARLRSHLRCSHDCAVPARRNQVAAMTKSLLEYLGD